MTERGSGAARLLVRRHPGLTLIALPCAILAVLASLVWFPGAPGGTGPGSVGVAAVRQNRPAPAFDLPRLSGSGRVRLDSLRGEVVVVNFWASWCTACQRETDALTAVAGEYSDADVHFVGINHADRRPAAQAFSAQHAMSYSSVVDNAGDMLAEYGALGLPTTYVIDRSGRIRYQVIGAVDAKTLRRCVDLVQAGAP